MLIEFLIGLAVFISIVIAVSVFINSDGDNKDDGGFDPHGGE